MDIIGLQAKASDWAESIIAGASSTALDTPTPCAEWDVKELLNHLIGGAHFFNMVVKHQAPPEGDFPDFVEMGPPATTYRAGADEYLASLRAEGALEGMVEPPFGTMPAQAFAGIAVIDTVAHGWDLAKATGQDATIPDDILEVVDPAARQSLGAFPRSPQVFDEIVEVPESASATDKFVAFLGRNPL